MPFAKVSRFLKAAVISTLATLSACNQRSNGSSPEPPSYAVLYPQTQHLSSGLESLVLDHFGGFADENRRDQVSLAVNSADEPLVVYDDIDSVPYSTRGGVSSAGQTSWGAWWRRKVAYLWSGYSAVAFDRRDRGHVCFDIWRWSNGEALVYGKLNRGIVNSGWATWYTDKDRSIGLDNDIAIDQEDKVHISYYSWASGRVKYATNAQGTWHIEDLADAVWNQTSVATDSANNAHLVHVTYVTPDYAVQYLTNASGNWQRTIIDNGTNPVIRFDRMGMLHVTYQKNNGLYHAANNGNSWAIESLPVTRTLSSGNRLSFEIDGNNKLMICYLSDARDSIYLMTNNSGQWREHQLDNGCNWVNPRIVVDKQDRVHIAGARQNLVHYLNFHPSQLPP